LRSPYPRCSSTRPSRATNTDAPTTCCSAITRLTGASRSCAGRCAEPRVMTDDSRSAAKQDGRAYITDLRDERALRRGGSKVYESAEERDARLAEWPAQGRAGLLHLVSIRDRSA